MASNRAAVNSDTLVPSWEERLIEISPQKIYMDAKLQSREKMRPHKVRDYEVAWMNGANFPPLTVIERFRTGERRPHYLLLDGWHRFQALQNVEEKLKKMRNGKLSVQVRVIQTPENASPHLLRWLAGRENLKNGLGLSNRDIRELFKAYVSGGQHKVGMKYKSYREIAQEIGLKPHQTIARWMKSFFPSVARAMSKDGDKEWENQGAKGTGNTRTTMPYLGGRTIQLICLDLLEEAKQAENHPRWEIMQEVSRLLERLKREAPCTTPSGEF